MTVVARADVCCVCSEHVKDAFTSESWLGELGTACEDVLCSSCLTETINKCLPHCRAEGTLRISCPHPGCGKMIPQKLVLAMSRQAQIVVEEIEQQTEASHNSSSTGSLNYRGTAEMCPVCCSTDTSVVEQKLWKLSDKRGDGHSFTCADVCWKCLSTWIQVKLPECEKMRELEMPCPGENCGSTLPVKLVLSLSDEAACLWNKLRRRRQLQANPMFPKEVQVNCPREACFGIGYLGQPTVMCFVCEEQWEASSPSSVQSAENFVMEGVKNCPNCKIPILKNGGCDHMHCTHCMHDSWWSTLEPYRKVMGL